MRFVPALLLAITAAGGVVPSASAVAAPVRFEAPEGFKLRPGGMLVHEKSGTRFPLVYGPFARTSNFGFDPSGKNIAVTYSYTTGGQVVEARIALVHVLMMSAHEHYIGLAPVVGTYFQGLRFARVRPLEDGALTIAGLKPDAAWQGRFSAVRGRTPYVLSLTTVDLGYWSARITAAYPRARASEAQLQITRLIGTLRAESPLRH